MFVRLLLAILFAHAALASAAEPYVIDATATGKEIRPMDYRLGTATGPDGTTFGANNYYLMRDGRPRLPVMGEIHYSRYPEHLWEEALLKMKAGGVDIVATYCFWNHHEEIEGAFDFTGRRDLRRFVELCARHGLYVWLRIGPWCHGEVRNGGFPDWLMERDIQRRRNDPEYLRLVQRLFAQYGKQVAGLMFKDGGPIIGIQLENEFGGPPEHIVELKRLAREVGFDVPFYTVTGWNNVRIPDREVLPVQAGYPDDFWTPGTARTPLNPQYLFMAGVPINTGVGTDVLPVLEVYGRRTYDPSGYPWLTAELGLGIQWTQRRRPVIDASDAAALALVKLAGGANAIGYYMYHGGSNPPGKLTPLNETGANQTPEVSYDFQAAIGEFGEITPKYRELRLLHAFVHGFGEDLAPMIPALPSRRPAGPGDVETFRTMLRADDDSGYLFFNNYQRFVENRDLEDVQVEVKLRSGSVLVPRTPITIPRDSFGILPVNLNLNSAILEYATAQPLMRMEVEGRTVVFFCAIDGIEPEFVFAPGTVAAIQSSGSSMKSDVDRRIFVPADPPGLDCVIDAQPIDGDPVQIRVLTRRQALNAHDLTVGGVRRLVITDGPDAMEAGDAIELRSVGRRTGRVWFFPTNDGAARFSDLAWAAGEADLDVTLERLDDTDGRTRYRLGIPRDALSGGGDRPIDFLLDFDQVSDYLTVHSDGTLIGDWYYIGPHYRPSLRHWGDAAIGRELTIELTPITPQTQVYLEDRFRPDFSIEQSIARIDAVTPVPVYSVRLSP